MSYNMNPAVSFIKVICLFFLMTGNLLAQKAEKGSSPDNPWNKEIRDDGNMFAYNSPIMNRSSLAFGEWKFETKYPSPYSKIKIPMADPGMFGKYLNTEPYNTRNAMLVTVDSMHVSARAPGDKPYGIYFSYRDSLIEQYNQIFLSLQHYHAYHFFRTLAGFVADTEQQPYPFSINLIFDDAAQQPVSYICTGKDTIFLRCLFNEKTKRLEKESASGASYAGFDFIKNDELVGSAHRKLNFVNETVYLYWFKPELDKGQQQAIAAMIFVIAGFIK